MAKNDSIGYCNPILYLKCSPNSKISAKSAVLKKMCQVCGSPEAKPHFGGISCRACAAVFRRYCYSKKLSLKCSCESQEKKTYPCRKCRIEKCIEIGMSENKIQGRRDKIAEKSIDQSSPENTVSFNHIPSRSTEMLCFAQSNWRNFESIRLEKAGKGSEMMNVYELSSIVKMDIDLIWKMVKNLFPNAAEKLKIGEISTLLNNFIIKFWQLIPLLDYLDNAEKYSNFALEDVEQMVNWFYDGCFPEEMSVEVFRKFESFWIFHYSKVILPIVSLQLEKTELMAIIWMMFFDDGFINISPECQEICRNIKKMILRELKNYQIDRNFDEIRFFDTLVSLEIIERGEKKFMEEMLICEMYNVRIHEDFKLILKENRL